MTLCMNANVDGILLFPDYRSLLDILGSTTFHIATRGVQLAVDMPARHIASVAAVAQLRSQAQTLAGRRPERVR